ncbi:MAG: 30S ribosomal protein S6--L-glutamate ligase [Bacteriovoracaceae bacterium]|nr:30S ribosomal protein S6--L-glutamate ligase [Bacteriovoracaceae bacterium]
MKKLKIGILCLKPENYSNGRLMEQFRLRGHEIEHIDYTKCDLYVGKDATDVFYEGRSLKYLDAIIPRVAIEHNFYALAVVRHFEAMNCYSLNGSIAIGRARDKLRSLQILAQHNLPIPKSAISNSTLNSQQLIDSLNGAPIVIKLIEGMQGKGTVLAETNQAAVSVVEAFSAIKTNLIVQEYIAESKGKDIRVFVVGNEIIACMQREAKEGDFRSNLHRGGKSSKVKLTAVEKKIALAAVKQLKLEVAGVDLISSNEGPLILEVNSSPGLEGIEKTSEVNVADKIVSFLEKDIAKFRKSKVKEQI